MPLAGTQMLQSAMLSVAATATKLQDLSILAGDSDGNHAWGIKALVQWHPTLHCCLTTAP
jgi:hypothetical protein